MKRGSFCCCGKGGLADADHLRVVQQAFGPSSSFMRLGIAMAIPSVLYPPSSQPDPFRDETVTAYRQGGISEYGGKCKRARGHPRQRTSSKAVLCDWTGPQMFEPSMPHCRLIDTMQNLNRFSHHLRPSHGLGLSG